MSKKDSADEMRTGEIPDGADDLKDERQGLEEKYKRALADYQNLLKRTSQEKMDFSRYANENLLAEILPVYDNLKISFNHLDESIEKNGWLTGIKCVIKQFREALLKAGVGEIKTAGEKFDYHAMEAIESVETQDESQDGSVAREVKSGYTLHGKAIIPAKVAVFAFQGKSEIPNPSANGTPLSDGKSETKSQGETDLRSGENN